jgi:O-antigen/teichoic acid export membrane protein
MPPAPARRDAWPRDSGNGRSSKRRPATAREPGARAGTGHDAVWSLVLETGRLFAGLTTFYLIAHVLGDAELGRYSAISGFVSLLNTLAATWLPQWVMESIVRRQRPAMQTLNKAIGANLTFAAIIGFGAFLTAPFLLRTLLKHVALQWVLLFLLAELISNCSAIWISMFAIRRGYAASCRLSLLNALGRPVLYIALWGSGVLSLRTMSICAISWSIAGGLVIGYLTGRMTGESMRAGRFGAEVLREGAPYALTNVAYSIQEDLDKPLMIELGHGNDAGPYAAAYRIIQIAMVPLRSLVMATHLRFLEAGRKSGPRLVIRQAIGLSLVSSVLAVFLGIGVLICQPLIVTILGKDYALSRPMLLPLLPLLVLRGLSWFPLNGLMALGHLKARVAVLATSASVNVVLNIALIPRYSWRGAVFSTVVAEIVFAGMAWGLLYTKHRADFGRYRGSHFRKST